MRITREQKGSFVVLAVQGRMDAQTSGEFEGICQDCASQGATDLIADLSGLEYISSAGLRSILASAKKIRGTGGTMKFCGLSGMVEEVFQVSGLGTMFTVAATAEEAFAS